MEIRKYTAEELYNWTNSLEYNNLADVPVSKQRALSYLKNPKLKHNEPIAYLLFESEKLIAYRTLLPDTLTINGKEQSICWFSGSWVHPEYRRKGLSTKLLNAIVEEKGNILGNSNWTPVSKKVFDQTASFNTINYSGIRCYLKFDLTGILSARFGKKPLNKMLLKTFDSATNCLLAPYYAYRKRKFNRSKLSCEFLHTPDDECISLMQKWSKNEPNCREKASFEWILSYPWIFETPFAGDLNRKYYFSTTSQRFSQFIIKYYTDNQAVGFAMISLRDGFLKIPYWYVDNEHVTEALKIVMKIAVNSNAKTLTSAHPDIVFTLFTNKWHCLIKRKFEHGFLFSKEIYAQIPQNAFFQDGDADGVFF
jgi:GNAT superfamily N-acetyltransferase